MSPLPDYHFGDFDLFIELLQITDHDVFLILPMPSLDRARLRAAGDWAGELNSKHQVPLPGAHVCQYGPEMLAIHNDDVESLSVIWPSLLVELPTGYHGW